MKKPTRIRKIKQASALLVSPFRRALHRQLDEARLARLRRAKRRFRDGRSSLKQRRLKGQPGINLVAYIRAEMGLGTIARGMASALESSQIPFNVINVETGNPSRHQDLSWSHKEIHRNPNYDITVVCINPDNSLYLKTKLAAKVLGDRYVIANWFWELPELPDEWLYGFQFVDEVWAPSQFTKDAVVRKSTVPVVRIPPVVQLSQTKLFSKSDLGLPERRFLFLAMFDTRSVLERKNPLGTLRAFQNAFPVGDTNVGLVMKFNNPDYQQPMLQELREEARTHPNVLIVDRIMECDEVSSLIRASDCFLSLHRSEGFGLGPAEAMSLGKPSILTKWSGNVDYMTPENSIGIDYELVKVGQNYGPYKAEQNWANPDLEQASYWMRKVVDDAELAKRIGAHAQETIRSNYSPEAVGRMIDQRLKQIRQNVA